MGLFLILLILLVNSEYISEYIRENGHNTLLYYTIKTLYILHHVVVRNFNSILTYRKLVGIEQFDVLQRFPSRIKTLFIKPFT